MKILGHRGAAGTSPENTLLSFAKGLEYGVGGFEFDVQLTRDGEVVVCHDERVDRTSNGVGWVKDFSLRELKALNFGVQFNQFAPIPTLDEVLEMLHDKPLLLNIEIKTGVWEYPGLVDKVALSLAKYNRLADSIISSFDHGTVVEVIHKYPGIATGLLYAAGPIKPWSYAKALKAGHLHPQFAFATPEVVAESHARGIGVNAWTVDEAWAMERMLQAGVNVVITNHPERFL